MSPLPKDADRLFVVEQLDGTTGRVRIVSLKDSSVQPSPFLELPELYVVDFGGTIYRIEEASQSG